MSHRGVGDFRRVGPDPGRGRGRGGPPITPITWLLSRDPVRARAQVIEAIELTGGNLTRAAWLLAIGRTTLWRQIYRHGLWAVVHRVRKSVRERRF